MKALSPRDERRVAGTTGADHSRRRDVTADNRLLPCYVDFAATHRYKGTVQHDMIHCADGTVC